MFLHAVFEIIAAAVIAFGVLAVAQRFILSGLRVQHKDGEKTKLWKKDGRE